MLAHLSLLFIPVGVGVMTHLALLGQYGGRMLFVIVLSTWIGLAVTAWTTVWLLRRGRGRSEQDERSEKPPHRPLSAPCSKRCCAAVRSAADRP